MTNSVGSRYIGTIGTSGGSAGYMHSHIAYFSSLKAMNIRRTKKVDLMEDHDPKNFLDFRTLVK